MKYLHKILFKMYPWVYYYEDGYPKRCTLCGNKNMDEVICNSIESYPCEIVTYCTRCGAKTAFWTRGYYKLSYLKHGAIK